MDGRESSGATAGALVSRVCGSDGEDSPCSGAAGSLTRRESAPKRLRAAKQCDGDGGNGENKDPFHGILLCWYSCTRPNTYLD